MLPCAVFSVAQQLTFKSSTFKFYKNMERKKIYIYTHKHKHIEMTSE